MPLPRARGVRLALLGLLLCAAAAAAAALLYERQAADLPPRAEAERPTLMLLTSLPLVFAERLSLDAGGSKTLEALESRYRVEPIAVTDESSLKNGSILLMAHARAQPAEALVALDAWVRRGGKLLLLADPLLEWHSERPLGDRMRPSPMFPDTGLLAHWGLRLDGPKERGAESRRLGGKDVLAISPGSLSGNCSIGRDGFVADCDIGKGRAIVVADADFLDVDEAGGSTERNLGALLAQLDTLEQM